MRRQSFHFLIIFLFLLVFAGCSSKTGQEAERKEPVAAVGTEDKVVFEMVEAAERSLDGAPALALTFSRPLDPKTVYTQHIRVFEMPEPGQAIKPAAPSYDEDGDNDDYSNGGEKVDAAPAVSTDPKLTDNTGGSEVKGGWIVGDNPRLLFFPNIKPMRRYVVYVMPEIAAADKQKLNREYRYSITSAEVSPAYYFASSGMVLPVGQNGGLPVVTVNTPEVDVEFLRVRDDQLPRFLDRVIAGKSVQKNPDDEEQGNDNDYYDYGRTNLQGSVDLWQLDRFHKMTQSVYRNRFVTETTENKRSVTFLPIESIKELKEPGIYIAVMALPGRFRYDYQVTYFYLSNIGLSLHRYTDNAQALVSSLVDGKAIAGVTVNWLDKTGKVLAQAETDGDGRAGFDVIPDQARVVLARKDDQVSMITLKEPSLDLSEFSVIGGLYRPTKLFAYSGRNLYRPGESFHLSVLARDSDGNAVVAQPIEARLRRPDGKVQWIASWQPDARFSGYYSRKLDLPFDAPTGTWSLELRNDPAEKQAGTVYAFSVEEFLPERMKLDLAMKQSGQEFNDPLTVEVNGSYLYGAPASGNQVLGVAEFKPDTNPLKETLPGFFFGNDDDKKLTSRKEIDKSELDAQGKTTLDIDPAFSSPSKSPFLVRATISLLESGGRPVIRSVEQTLWPTEEILGLRPLFSGNYAKEGSLAGFEVVRANKQGVIAAPAELQARLFREDRDYYWRFDDNRGWNSGYTTTGELVGVFPVTLADSGRGMLEVPVIYGRYRIELIDPQSDALTNYRFYAGWSAEQNEKDGVRPDRVTLTLDKPAYAEGETAQLTIAAPHKGQAIIAVEADRLLWLKRITIDSDKQQVAIPLDKNWKRHDLYVSVTVLRPGNEGQMVTPARALGIVHLGLDRSARQYKVNIDAPDKVRPETTAKVKVRVEAAEGQKVMATLSAVDVGILNITNFVTPDPFEFFFGQLRFGADLKDIYGRLIEKMAGKKGTLKFGGDTSMKPTQGLPQKVKLIDLFSGPVELDGNGEAEIALPLPDFNGKLRLMTVVASENSFGKAEKEMTVAAPLIVELATPRFIGIGDETLLALDLHNLSGAAQQLNIQLTGSSGLTVINPERSLNLDDQQKSTVHFKVTAAGVPYLADLRVQVTGQGLEIDRNFPLQINAQTPPQTHIVSLVVDPGQTVDISSVAAEQDWYLESESISAVIDNHHAIDVRQAIQGLLKYPYGCTEQTVSSSYPHVFIDDQIAKHYGLRPYTRDERVVMLDKSVAKLAGMQAANGGFSLWGDVSAYEYWLSAYVTQFLQDARAQGFGVPDETYRKATDFLLKEMTNGLATLPDIVLSVPSSWDGAWSQRNNNFGSLAYGAYVLAQDRKITLSTLRQLYDKRASASSSLALVQLGIALVVMGDETRGQTALAEGMSKVRLTNNWYDYGSDLRDDALSYALLKKHKQAVNNEGVLLGRVGNYLKEFRYLSTQERFAVFLAGRYLDETPAGKWRATLVRGQTEQALEQERKLFTEFSAADLASGSRIRNQTEDKLFVMLTYTGLPKKALPTGGAITLTREYFDAKGAPLSSSDLGSGKLKTGDTVWVKLTAERGRENTLNTLIVDRIPAGLEIENTNLIQGETGDTVTIGNTVPSEAMQDKRIQHTEFRDDRFVAAVRLAGWWDDPIQLFYRARVVTPGRFIMPSLYAEEMYRPELRGSYGGGELLVVDPGIVVDTGDSAAAAPVPAVPEQAPAAEPTPSPAPEAKPAVEPVAPAVEQPPVHHHDVAPEQATPAVEPAPVPEQAAPAVEPAPVPEQAAPAVEPAPVPEQAAPAVEPAPVPEQAAPAVEPAPVPEQAPAAEPTPSPAPEATPAVEPVAPAVEQPPVHHHDVVPEQAAPVVEPAPVPEQATPAVEPAPVPEATPAVEPVAPAVEQPPVHHHDVAPEQAAPAAEPAPAPEQEPAREDSSSEQAPSEEDAKPAEAISL